MAGKFSWFDGLLWPAVCIEEIILLNVLIKLINLMRIPASICDKARFQIKKNSYPEENYA